MQDGKGGGWDEGCRWLPGEPAEVLQIQGFLLDSRPFDKQGNMLLKYGSSDQGVNETKHYACGHASSFPREEGNTSPRASQEQNISFLGSKSAFRLHFYTVTEFEGGHTPQAVTTTPDFPRGGDTETHLGLLLLALSNWNDLDQGWPH